MEKNVITIEHNKTALDAACLISEKDVSFLVIMKGDVPVGVLSESDFVKRLAADNKKASDVIVSEIMISHYDRKLYQLEKRRKEALGVRK